MKNIFFICLCALFAFTGCADDDDDLLTGGNVDIDLLPDSKPNDVVNTNVFDIINLNYPGLEKVKEFYETGEYYYAANALLEYYRTRTNVTNPNLSLINVTISEADQAKADYALEDYRFHVNNFYEDQETLKPYSLKKDGTINWTFSPEGASDEYQKQLHRHQWFIPQAKAYRISGSEKYIQSWIEVYNNWINQNPKPESGTNTTSWWQLQVATRINDQVQLLEYFKNSINFTPEWLTTFLVEFAEQADFLVDYPYESGGNILISQANALATAGTLMPEFKNAEKWMETGYQILSEEVQNQIMSDGWHKEMSLHYHIGIVADFYEAMKLAEANQLSSKLPSNFTEPLRKAAEVVMHFTYPNYFSKGSDNVVPMFNDSWSRTRNVLKNTNFKQYVEMFPDSEELKYMQTAGNGGTPQGHTPNNDMKLFDQAGYYVLRNGWTYGSTVMILSNNKSNDASNSISAYSHNQPDNGTFELYHNGRNFFPDSGVCTYYSTGGDNTRIYNRLLLNIL
ncbi:heparin-sulfate lyase HepC [Bacteroides sp. AF32-8BH]|uniref:heparin-sulfate lyase HepC n=1 Tax=Bacteroides sp. AF32-8BH TaxID=2302925 RepID=UPI001F2796F2|nr:heparin-sulfate lyase HepC [Bacteroides sp. AF32-8BH]